MDAFEENERCVPAWVSGSQDSMQFAVLYENPSFTRIVRGRWTINPVKVDQVNGASARAVIRKIVAIDHDSIDRDIAALSRNLATWTAHDSVQIRSRLHHTDDCHPRRIDATRITRSHVSRCG